MHRRSSSGELYTATSDVIVADYIVKLSYRGPATRRQQYIRPQRRWHKRSIELLRSRLRAQQLLRRLSPYRVPVLLWKPVMAARGKPTPPTLQPL